MNVGPFVCAVMAAAWLTNCSDRRRGPQESSATRDGAANAGAPASDAGSLPSFIPASCAPQPNCDNGFCRIAAGSFMMGSPPDEAYRGRNNEDLVKVTLTHSFLLQQTEVTQGQWKSMGFPNRAGTKPDEGAGNDCLDDSCPAAVLGWCEAALFANQLSRMEGRRECMILTNPRGTVGVDYVCDGAEPLDSSYYECDGYRLPTSGEWEYATRAGTTTPFFSGPWEAPIDRCYDLPHLSRVAWYCANAGRSTHAVCTREPNPWGLYDLLGNASEAVADPGASGYGPDDVVDPPLAVEREIGMRALHPRLFRGANWYSDPYVLRVAAQARQQSVSDAKSRDPGEGFRLARTLITPE